MCILQNKCQKVFSIHRQTQNSLKKKKVCEETLYCFFSIRMRGKGSSCPCWYIEDPHFLLTALHPPPHLASNQGGPADVSSETTNMIPNTAGRITDHYGTRFCNSFCSTSSLEIKASCISVTARSPLLLQPSFFCSKPTPLLIAIKDTAPHSSRSERWKRRLLFFPRIPRARQQSEFNP